MRHFLNVISAHWLSEVLFEQAHPAGDSLSDGAILARSINTQAYFVLVFSQLEAEINGLCGDLICRMQALPHSKDRRAWDIIDDRNVRGLHFMKRVALLTAKGGRVYNRIKELYEARSMIAHGELLSESLDLTLIAEEIQDIAAQLKDAL